MKPKPIIWGLALAALFFAILLPPEAYPDGKTAVLLCSTFAFFASMSERRISPRYLWGGLVVFTVLLLHSLFISVDLYRSLDLMTALWTYYCLAGFFLYAGMDPFVPVAVCMVALTLIVSVYGLYQFFWGFDQTYSYIFYSASDQVVKTPALERIATHRVFSTLALPGTLWGFLVVALPFHAALWRTKSRAIDALLACSAALLLVTGLLTRSFGFLVGLLVLTFTWLWLRHRRVLWNKLSAVLLVLAILGGSFYSARRGVIEGSNPAGLRFDNWVSAWSIFSMNPLGTGLNTYGVEYPRYMLANSNETQYAHNTPLQLMSELGWIFLLAAAGTLLFVVSRWNRWKLARGPSVSPYLLLALAAWCVHNLIDINIYFPSMGVVGAILVGTLLARSDVPKWTIGKSVTAGVAALGIAAIVFSGFSFVSEELQHRAQVEYESSKPFVAIATLEQAKQVMPINSSLFHSSGEMLLDVFHKSHDAKYLTAATASFQRAIALSPVKVGPHVGYGLCLSSADQVDTALKEVRIAQALYPDSAYVQSVLRLMEQRKAAMP